MNIISIKTNLKSYIALGDLVKKPHANLKYISLWRESLEFMNSYAPRNLTENEISWIDDLALSTSVSIKKSSPNWLHGYYLYDLIKQMSIKKKAPIFTYFETGSAKGFSAIVASQAILSSGKVPNVISIDILKNERKRYWNALGDSDGRRNRNDLLYNYKDQLKYIKFIKLRSQKLNSDFLENLEIDFAFLDGAHTYKAVKHEFNYVSQYLDNDGAVFFDDFNVIEYPEVAKFINQLPINHVELINLNNNNRKYAIYRKN